MKSYSEDLRKAVVAAVSGGMSKAEAGRVFGISQNALFSWLRLLKKRGVLTPMRVGGSKGRINKDEFEAFVCANPDLTLKEIGMHFKISANSAHYRMRQLNFSYKKRLSIQRTTGKITSGIWRKTKRN